MISVGRSILSAPAPGAARSLSNNSFQFPTASNATPVCRAVSAIRARKKRSSTSAIIFPNAFSKKVYGQNSIRCPPVPFPSKRRSFDIGRRFAV